MRGGDKPTREDALAYYRGVVAARNLNLATWESITALEPSQDGFRITTRREPNGATGVQRFARAIVLATGVWDQPRTLTCEGADLPHVHYRFYEPTEYFGHSVLVVGGGNSAVTTALSLSEAHAKVTFAMRRPPKAYQSHLRPFIVRDLEFAVADGKIDLRPETIVTRIEEEEAWLQPAVYDPEHPRPISEPYAIPARFVFALLGQTADSTFLERIGLAVGPDGRPISDSATHETQIPGIFVAGSIQSQEVDIVIKGRKQARAAVRSAAERLKIVREI